METKNKKINSTVGLDKYKDMEGVSMQKLDFGFWWVKNKNTLRVSLITFLILISVGFWGYTLFSWTYYYAVLVAEDNVMVGELVSLETVSSEFLVARSAQDLKTSPVFVTEIGGRYDFYTILESPNKNHWGRFSYCFMFNDKKIECDDSFILPGERKYIFSLGNEMDKKPNALQFVVNDFSWYKINKHDISNWTVYKNEHLDFLIEDKEFTQAVDSDLSDKLNINVLKFSITNESPYDYYEFPLNIVLFKSGRVSAVNRYVIKDLFSNRKEDIKITWPGYLGAISSAEIVPDLNILRKDIYSF